MSAKHAYLNIKIDDLDITAEPDYVTGFVYERKTTDSGNIMSFTVYDQLAMQIEAMLIEGSKSVEFSYGLSPQSSRTYIAQVMDWRPVLTGWGATITVECVTTAIADKNKGSKQSYEGSPSDVVRQVAEEEGWSLGVIEPTQQINHHDMKNKLTPKQFYRDGLSATHFLNERVLPFAVSRLTGNSGYYLYFTDTEPSTVNFHTEKYKTSSEVLDISFIVGSGDSDVIDWSPNYSGAALLSSEGLLLEYQDNTGKLQQVIKGNKNDLQRKVVRVRSREEAEALSEYMWALKRRYSYTGNLTLVNRPHIDPFTTISLLVLSNYNVPHHTSGLYTVITTKDTIVGGLISSELLVLGEMA